MSEKTANWSSRISPNKMSGSKDSLIQEPLRILYIEMVLFFGLVWFLTISKAVVLTVEDNFAI